MKMNEECASENECGQKLNWSAGLLRRSLLRMKPLLVLRILSGIRFRPCCPSLLFSVLARTTRRFGFIRGIETARRIPPVGAIIAVRAYRFCKVCPLAGCILRKAGEDCQTSTLTVILLRTPLYKTYIPPPWGQTSLPVSSSTVCC